MALYEVNARRLSSVPEEVIALLKALHFKKSSNQDLRQLGDEQWQRLLRFSDRAHLTLPLALGDTAGYPLGVRERLEKNLDDNKARFRRVRTTYLEASNALHHANVDHLVIKGFTLAPDYVSLPWMRQQSDIDLYCGKDNIESAQAALGGIGYTPNRQLNYSAADHSPTLLRLGDWKWQGNAFDPQMPLSIELHFCLWNERVSLFPISEVDNFFVRREMRWIEGIHAPVLHPVDQLGHISIHILRNLLAHDSVMHHLFELATFLEGKANDDEFWTEWQDQHSEGLRSKEAIAFDLARQWFGCSLSDAAKLQITKLSEVQQQWLGEFGHVPLEVSFRENRDAVWLHWNLIEEEDRRGHLLRRSFLPNRLPNPDMPAQVLSRREVQSKRGYRIVRLISYCYRRLVPYVSLHLRTLYHGAQWVARSPNGCYER